MNKAIVVAALAVLCAVPSSAQLGSIDFANSGRPEAQQAFLRGVAALHSFWYEEAADAFREAQKADPGFALAYWGEAMTYNHPIWMEVEVDAARAALGRLGADAAARAGKAGDGRERGLLAAVEVLYGEGEKESRDLAYEAAMARLARTYPDDAEIQAFHALSILGTMTQGEPDARKQIRAASILEPLFAPKADHPGVLHYLIHAYDDPVHAPLGLRAARLYAKVAPAAFHARHMPSHIFLQLGMWDETVASNEQSYGVSKEWVERKGLPRAKRDLHSLQWLQYGYLQQGRIGDAKKLIVEVAPAVGEGAREQTTRAFMLARQAIETGDWSIVADDPVAQGAEGGHAACSPNAGGDSSPLVFARGLSAVARGDAEAAKKAVEQLNAMAEGKKPVAARTIRVMTLELEASLAAAEGKMPRALDLASQAVAIEETLGAPSGPPDTFKPANELYGELLLRAGRREEAERQFAAALLRTPNRRLSVQGAQRAAAAAKVAGQ